MTTNANDKMAYAGDYKENGGLSPTKSEEYDIMNEFSPAEQKNIIHRIDRRLVTTVGFMYCISLMDRTNLAAASIAGMTRELEMTVGFRYVRRPYSAS